MFILTSIAINSSLTSKRAHMCFSSNSSISNGSMTFLKLFPLVALIRFPNIRKKKKRLKPSFYCLREMSISPSPDIILKIPTLKICGNEFQTWCPNFTMIQRLTSLRSQFYWDRFWVSIGKEKVTMRRELVSPQTIFTISNGENVCK